MSGKPEYYDSRIVWEITKAQIRFGIFRALPVDEVMKVTDLSWLDLSPSAPLMTLSTNFASFLSLIPSAREKKS